MLVFPFTTHLFAVGLGRYAIDVSFGGPHCSAA
jgi:hypothetical protein